MVVVSRVVVTWNLRGSISALVCGSSYCSVVVVVAVGVARWRITDVCAPVGCAAVKASQSTPPPRPRPAHPQPPPLLHPIRLV